MVGIFYLLLFWTLIPGLIALIEGIVFLVTSDESWNDRHNEGKPNVGGEGSAGLVIALVGGVFVAIIVVGILAAIAIPAYQDYTIKAKVTASMAAATQVREAVEQFIIDERAYPGSNADLGIAEQAASDGVHTFTVQEGGVIVMSFTGKIRTLETKTLIFTPRIEDNTIYWDCLGGTLKARYRPAECR